MQELSALKFVTVEKAGRCDYVSAADEGKALCEKALPHMVSPVQKRLHVRDSAEFQHLPWAGEYALSVRSMLNPPMVKCKAMSRKAYKHLAEVEVVDPAWSSSPDYIQLELWKYDPSLLASPSGVDVISLALSLRDNGDERVEQAVEEMMEGYKW